ncbi:hypothetical protein H2204_014723 [Knufia peltigerae]|uniref:Uncharacterized protein n=1 Tax=Knufia peltigerae TaxID=1002370 RepID=A0AA38XHS4_9EURO|nr:hypothetical protein H2204_014723 [Knufia peltigerae]
MSLHVPQLLTSARYPGRLDSAFMIKIEPPINLKMKYTDVKLSISGQVGTITMSRPKALHAFGDSLKMDLIVALRELDQHPDTLITLITAEGRFFSAGADINDVVPPPDPPTPAHKKVAILAWYAPVLELVRSMIDHRKVLVVAMNGPAVGGAVGWLLGVADIVLASDSCWIDAPFSKLGLVPEFGCATNFAQSMGVHRTNELMIFGRKMTAQELVVSGLVNRVFPTSSFHRDVGTYLQEQVQLNSGRSMLEAKRLMNESVRDSRLVAIMTSLDSLAERMVEGEAYEKFAEQRKKINAKKESKL